MQIFIDTADIEEIRDAAAMGVIDGVTTNPSLVAKTGRPFKDVIVDICEVVDGPISAEVIATDYEGMVKEARSLAKMHDNIVVKIPLIAEGLKAVRTLTDEGIRTNVTLCFSPTQGLLAAKAGATYVSPFIGRRPRGAGIARRSACRDHSAQGHPPVAEASAHRHRSRAVPGGRQEDSDKLTRRESLPSPRVMHAA
jgi:TalC/MipB family fructose-6-phosphate aldolase